VEYPKETGKTYICTLDNGEVIESEFIICPNLGMQYFREVINTGRYVVSWKYKTNKQEFCR